MLLEVFLFTGIKNKLTSAINAIDRDAASYFWGITGGCGCQVTGRVCLLLTNQLFTPYSLKDYHAGYRHVTGLVTLDYFLPL